MNEKQSTIVTGSRIAVVGGGPAGSFFALYLQHYAKERGIHPEITIYEERDFNSPGPKGCKGCAGIPSPNLTRNLRELNLRLPEQVVLARIEDYVLHSPYTSISIAQPEKGMEIASVYRGGGPRLSHFDSPVSFDSWLLEQAQEKGAGIEDKRVSGISVERQPAVEADGSRREFDLVVLACGVNSGSVSIAGVDYAPPQTRTMDVMELQADADEVKSRLGNAAHAFVIPDSGLVFATLVPKGPFINVVLLNIGKHPMSIADFLNNGLVRSLLPDKYERSCACRPRAPVSSARNFYADGFVAIGDAAASRLYKDGIGFALLTARRAAWTAVHQGTTRRDFQRHYGPLCRAIDRDNRWGKLLLSVTSKAKNSRSFLLAQHRLIADEQTRRRGSQPITRGTWGIFTGSESYRNIARMTLGPASLARLFLALCREGIGGLLRPAAASRRKLHIGAVKVLILGSGFGGTYVLRRLVPALNPNENIETTMVSDENFFLFAPLLHEVAMGRIETRHIAYPIRRLHWRDRFNFVQATVENIDLGRRCVTTSGGIFEFDYLVLALGSRTDTAGLGPANHGQTVFTLKTLHDSMLIRNHIIGLFEQASFEKDPVRRRKLLTFVVCGGGHTGVQVVTELRDFIFRHLLRFYHLAGASDIRIMLVAAESGVVTELHPKLGAHVMKHLLRAGIEVKTRSRVTQVREDSVEINGSEIVPSATVIWMAGVIAHPLVAELPAERDDVGRVAVNQYMEVPGWPGVYAVGDCAHFKDPASGRPIPPRAHTAVRQAVVVADNVLADIRGGDKRPYRYTNTAEAVSLGNSDAVVRLRGLRFHGSLARLMWLAGYSLLVTGTPNRLRIMVDWLLSSAFGRDVTFIKLTRR